MGCQKQGHVFWSFACPHVHMRCYMSVALLLPDFAADNLCVICEAIYKSML